MVTSTRCGSTSSRGWHHEDRTALLPGVPAAVGDPFGYAFINEPDRPGRAAQPVPLRGRPHPRAVVQLRPEAGTTRIAPRSAGRACCGRRPVRLRVHQRTRPAWSSSITCSAPRTATSTRCGSTSPGAGTTRTAPRSAGRPSCGRRPVRLRVHQRTPTGLVEQHNLFRSADGHIHALWFNFAQRLAPRGSHHAPAGRPRLR